jgi:hypothetical protein
VTAALVDAGLPIIADDVVTAPALTASFIAEHYPGARCQLLNSGDIRDDLTDVRLVEDGASVDVIIIGGAGTEFSYAALNRAFAHLRNGARLVAMHRNLYWRTHEGLQLDGGAFLLGLEAAASVTAEVVGKPAPGFFTSALSRLHVDAAEAVMVGDDIDADVLGAQRLGIPGCSSRPASFTRGPRGRRRHPRSRCGLDHRCPRPAGANPVAGREPSAGFQEARAQPGQPHPSGFPMTARARAGGYLTRAIAASARLRLPASPAVGAGEGG